MMHYIKGILEAQSSGHPEVDSQVQAQTSPVTTRKWLDGRIAPPLTIEGVG
jgi:hypothetical protein